MSETSRDFYNAVVFGSMEQVREMIAQRPSLTQESDKYGLLPLHWVMTEDRPDMAELLIASGADVHARDTMGMTPLHLAQETSMVEVLIRHGAKVNSRTDDGSTPLHLCANAGEETYSVELMEALLKVGADPNLKDNRGKTALDYALGGGEDEKVLLLRGHGVTAEKANPSNISHPNIAIRLYVEARNACEAEATVTSIQGKLAGYGQIGRSYTKQYWKIAAYFEIFFDIETTGDAATAFENMLITLGKGWQIHRFQDGNNWAVWNPSDAAAFALPEVRWAHVECSQHGKQNVVGQEEVDDEHNF